MIQVTRDIDIDENEITERFVHASGPAASAVNGGSGATHAAG